MDYLSLGPRVPTIIISPYARPHFVDHSVMEFDSILRFIEDDFRLPSLTARDRNARSLITSLNFRQRPLQPFLLKHKTCDKAAYNTHMRLRGTFLKLVVRKYDKEVLLRVSGGNIATLIIGPSIPLRLANNAHAQISDYQKGDRILATVRPDPQRALVYGAGLIHDLELTQLNGAQGVVMGTGQFGSTIVVKFQKRSLVVDIGKGTKITVKHSQAGSIADLEAGDTVAVTGIVNNRISEMTTTRSIDVLQQPTAKGNGAS
jgi:hypothetical protein